MLDPISRNTGKKILECSEEVSFKEKKKLTLLIDT